MSAESARFIVVRDNLSLLQRRALSAAANDDTRLYASEVLQRFQIGIRLGCRREPMPG